MFTKTLQRLQSQNNQRSVNVKNATVGRGLRDAANGSRQGDGKCASVEVEEQKETGEESRQEKVGRKI